MNTKLFSIFFLSILLLSSCTSQRKIREQNNKALVSWIGANKSDLILKWGPPKRYDSDGKGGEILIYEQKIGRGVVKYGTEATKHPITMFYVKEGGIIYYCKTGS
jgi:hypothetical protein